MGSKKSERVAGRRGWTKAARVTGIAVVADEMEWRALADDNALFKCADYATYLAGVERRIKAAARAGRQVLVGPLMPDQFETRAEAAGLARDSPRALKEYERFVAELGPLTLPWQGEPITQVLERIRAHVRAETLQAKAMPMLAAAAVLHAEPDAAAQRAMSKSAHVFMALIEDSGDGRHELRVTVQTREGELDYTLPYTRCAKVIAFPDDGGEHMIVVLLSIAMLADCPGTVLLRSRPQATFFPPRRKPRSWDDSQRPDTALPASTPTTPALPAADTRAAAAAADSDSTSNSAPTPSPTRGAAVWERHESTLRGWRLAGDLPQPMTEGQLFAFVCTGSDGDPIPPEPGTRFRKGFPLDPGRFRCCE